MHNQHLNFIPFKSNIKKEFRMDKQDKYILLKKYAIKNSQLSSIEYFGNAKKNIVILVMSL